MPAASNAMCSSQLQELYIPLTDNLAEEHVRHHSIKSFLFERQERWQSTMQSYLNNRMGATVFSLS
jgi:hypothetical protein